MHKIKHRCFFLHGNDDLIMHPPSIPYDNFMKLPNNLLLGTTDGGSHCCHLVHGSSLLTWLLPIAWYPEPLMEFVDYIERIDKEAVKSKA